MNNNIINYITRENLNNIIEQRFVPYNELDLTIHGYFVFIMFNNQTNEFVSCYSFDDEETEYTKQFDIYNRNKNNYDYALFYDVDNNIYYCVNDDFVVNKTILNKKDIIHQFKDWYYSRS